MARTRFSGDAVVAGPRLGSGCQVVERRSDGERYGAGLRSSSRVAQGCGCCRSAGPASASESSCRDHTTSRAPETFEILLHSCRKCPHSRAGSVGGRCQNSLYDNGIRRHRQHPVTSTIAAITRAAARGRRPRAVDPAPGRDRDQPDRAGRSCGTRSPSSSSATPTTPTASTSARNHGAADTAATGPTPPGRPNGTPNAAWTSRTPWTTTTSRSGTRWPPAACPRSRRW